MKTLTNLTLLAALACPLYAVDGVVLISQNAAIAGNVTPGDTPGFPVTISVPGSYRLSTNLTVPDTSTDAILITANDVTLDLNGFSIIGPAVCKGFPPVCSPVVVGNGVTSFSDDITVLRGKIRGMGFGIFLRGNASRVEKIHAIGNAGAGISATATGDNSVIRCAANGNAGEGISVSGLADGNTAMFNGGNGISIFGSAIHNLSANNQTGIFGSGTFLGNTVLFNSTQGISARCLSAIVSNTAEGNVGGDIFTSGSGCVLSGNAFKP
jgi:hypothetical protein